MYAPVRRTGTAPDIKLDLAWIMYHGISSGTHISKVGLISKGMYAPSNSSLLGGSGLCMIVSKELNLILHGMIPNNNRVP